MLAAVSAESLLRDAIAALDGPPDMVIDALNALPVPVYVADRDGSVTHFNRACIAFAGRVPDLENDRWCVCWRLWTLAGDLLPAENCAMAIAIREQRAVRDEEAIIERPDGTRIQVRGYPTPIFDTNGEFLGAINLMIDVTAEREIEHLRAQAARCRWLITTLDEQASIAALTAMAEQYEVDAAQILRGLPIGKDTGFTPS